MLPATLVRAGIGELSHVSPMVGWSDTSARLAVEDRGARSIVEACADPVARLDAIIGAAYGERAIDHYTLSN